MECDNCGGIGVYKCDNCGCVVCLDCIEKDTECVKCGRGNFKEIK